MNLVYSLKGESGTSYQDQKHFRHFGLNLAAVATVASTCVSLGVYDYHIKPYSIAKSDAQSIEVSKIKNAITADTAKDGISFDDACKFVLASLKKMELYPDRESITGDGSKLFQFLGSNRACVDIYPSGTIVVIIKTLIGEDLYELGIEDTDFILTLLKDARVKA